MIHGAHVWSVARTTLFDVSGDLFSSVQGHVAKILELVGTVIEPPHGRAQQCFDDDVLAHFGAAVLSFDELDRDLSDGHALLEGAPGEVELETVTSRGDVVESDGAQGVSTEGVESAGGIFDADPQAHPRPQTATSGDEFAVLWPVDHRSTLDVAGPFDHVGLLKGFQQQRQLLRLVGAVGVHFD